jgi:hypothetical protein
MPRQSDTMVDPFLPENKWMIDQIRQEFGNIPEEVLMDILRRRYANGGPQMKNPQLMSPMPTKPQVGPFLQGGMTHDPHDPLGLELPLKGLRF